MVLRRIGVAVSAMLLVGAGMGIARIAGAAPEARVTSHTLTIGGLEFRSLDYRSFPQFYSGSGGGVYRLEFMGPDVEKVYFEAAVHLPAGVNVTEVDYIYRDCGLTSPYGGFYFGSYSPGVGFTDNLPEADSPDISCTKSTFKRVLPTPVQIAAARFYVAGFFSTIAVSQPAGTPLFMVFGARVGSPCPTGG